MAAQPAATLVPRAARIYFLCIKLAEIRFKMYEINNRDLSLRVENYCICWNTVVESLHSAYF